MTDISGTIVPRRPSSDERAEIFVRPGGDDAAAGTASAPLATFLEAASRVRAHCWRRRTIIDITGVDEQPGFDVAIDLPLAGEEFVFELAPVTHRTHIVEATYTVRAVPQIIADIGSPAVIADPTHGMLALTVSPDPGWAPDEHFRRFICGQGFFETGAIIGNTSDTLLVAYAGVLTPPVEILAPGARLRFGTEALGPEFNPGMIVQSRCGNAWQWIDFAIPPGNPATSLFVQGAGGTADFFGCAFDGLEIRRGAQATIDACAITRSWGFNGCAYGSEMKRAAIRGAIAASHAGTTFILNCRLRGSGPLGTGGTASYDGATTVEDCESVDAIGNGWEAQGQGRQTIRRTVIDAAAGDAISVNGPLRAVIDDVQGAGSAGYGLRILNGAQAEVRNGTAVSGVQGDIWAGALGAKSWGAVPFSDAAGPDPHFVRVHTPAIISGDPAPAGGAWQLIETIKVVTATTDVIFSGLDGDADRKYLIAGGWMMGGGAGATRRLIIMPNGLTSGQVSTWMFGGGSSPGSEVSTRLVACPHEGAGRDAAMFEARLEVAAASGRTGRQLLFSSGDGLAAPTPLAANFRTHHGHGLWSNTTTTVSSLVLRVVDSTNATIASGIAGGSEFSLYRAVQ